MAKRILGITGVAMWAIVLNIVANWLSDPAEKKLGVIGDVASWSGLPYATLAVLMVVWGGIYWWISRNPRDAVPSPSRHPESAIPIAGSPTVAPRRDFRSQYHAPLEFEPLKRMLADESGGVLALIKVRNPHLRPEPVTNCTARVVGVFYRVPELNDDGVPSFKECQLELPAVYLKWIEQDGGGKAATFANDASFEVAVIQDPPDEWVQLQTVNEALREQYRIDLGLSPTLVIEVCDDLGRRAEHGFEISRNAYAGLMKSLKGTTQVTSMQLVIFKVSDTWREKALQRVASYDQAVGGTDARGAVTGNRL